LATVSVKQLAKKALSALKARLTPLDIYIYFLDSYYFKKSKISKQKLDAIPTNGKLIVGILCKDRSFYLEKCLSSLQESIKNGLPDEQEILVFLFDDGSKDKVAKKLIYEFEVSGENVKVMKFNRPVSGKSWASSYNWAVSQMLKIAQSGDLIGTVDSDIIFSKNWIPDFTIWAREVRSNRHSRIMYFSAFNSSDYIFHKPLKLIKFRETSYVEKFRIGGCHYFTFYDDLRKISKFPKSIKLRTKVLKGFDDESRNTRKLAKRGFLNASLSRSLVEHLGAESLLNEFRETPVDKPIYGLNLVPNFNFKQLGLNRESTMGMLQAIPSQSVASKADLEILIPIGPKDVEIAHNSVIAALEAFNSSSERVSLLCSRAIFEFLKRNLPSGINFIDEAQFLNPRLEPWINQQFMKWDASMEIGKRTLILDADTILLNSSTLNTNRPNFLLVNDEVVHDYRKLISKLLNLDTFYPYSFVTHHQILDVSLLSLLQTRISEFHSRNWREVALELLKFNPDFKFSEYEIYGQFILSSGSNYSVDFSYNRSMGRDFIEHPRILRSKWEADFDSLSYHWYLPKSYMLEPGYARSMRGETF
jgi:hypothetical protein